MLKLIFLRSTFNLFSDNDIRVGQLTGTCLTIMLIISLVCFLVSEITRNYSQVDKLWSIMPVIYSLVSFSAYPSPRLGVMFCLVMIWGLRMSFYFFGVAASGNWINWTIAGPILLILLFLGSTALTERISSNKYPDYIVYKKEVPKFLPRFFKSENKKITLAE